MPSDISAPATADHELFPGTPTLACSGEVEIAGRRYVTGDRLAKMLNVTTRTLARWNAARIGPPKIAIGKTILYEVGKLPDWLASRETAAPIRNKRG
jgi:DNA-binding transcriptional regulator YiaG